MLKDYEYDVVVVGSGPNGLAAAITLAQAGCSVIVFEAKSTVGGGARSAELTLPGFVHDICSAIYPLGVGSPFFKTLPLANHGLEWIHPPAPLAHPFDDGTAAVLERSIDATCKMLDQDAKAYRRLMEPLVSDWDKLANGLLGPLQLPPHPIAMARFGISAIQLIESVDELPTARATLVDVTPRQLLRMAGHRLPVKYRRRLEGYRYGPGVFKVDFALDCPIPWKAKECARAGTVHLGGTLDEIAIGERMMWEGRHPEKPYVLLAQQSLFDPTRAPEGKHTAWAYCHVPNGSTFDMTERIEKQIERFAPGFRNLILARSSKSPAELEQYNPNYIGGDINGGVQDLRQLFTRPVARLVPYSTPIKGLYICSSSTPPGGGVHGMCGYHAARAALHEIFSYK
jgi:phytoene dehydrogenase-like protein